MPKSHGPPFFKSWPYHILQHKQAGAISQTDGLLSPPLQSRAVDIGKVGPYWRLPPLRSAPPPFDALCNILHSQVRHDTKEGARSKAFVLSTCTHFGREL